jgi:hypothetical protein
VPTPFTDDVLGLARLRAKSFGLLDRVACEMLSFVEDEVS